MPTKLTSEHLKLMNIGKRFWGATRRGLTESQLIAVGKYLENLEEHIRRGVGMFLWGDNSVGKSYVGAVLCKAVWGLHRVPSFCATAAELKDAWIDDRPLFLESRETFCGRSSQVRFLVIDDLGREHRSSTGFAENKFGALLRQRSRDKKTTVVTTNLDPEAYKSIYGKAAYELVRECMVIQEMKGSNLRAVIANRNLAGLGWSE
jgi:DNA replication protein DnaC